ncbi:hypothetical protein LFWB_1640 [Candidatus Phytoplasma luffae]|uniref:Uncharacterized protein n=1 Tax=Loofah witches'-broom phytoplasma TaxID=35773 RepID=A0A975IM45_LOWBP|nr:hypothetical protein [Candidatus Phytoplasma luffae]QTX02734.1 hypothetical protein LFWB_1640 [Candidatus Phytoplasma luffae]
MQKSTLLALQEVDEHYDAIIQKLRVANNLSEITNKIKQCNENKTALREALCEELEKIFNLANCAPEKNRGYNFYKQGNAEYEKDNENKHEAIKNFQASKLVLSLDSELMDGDASTT